MRSARDLPRWRTRIARRQGGLIGGSAINFVGLAIGSASQFGVVLVLARLLSTETAGVFLLGFATFRIAVGLCGVGVNITAVRYGALARARGDVEAARSASFTVLAIAIAGGLLGTVLLAGTAGIFADGFHAPALGPVLIVFAVGIPLSTFTLTAAGVARGARQTARAIFLEQVADSGFRFAGMVVGLILERSAMGAAIGFTSGGAVAAVTAACMTAPEWMGGRMQRGPELHHLVRFSAFQWGTVFTGTAFRWADSLLLGLWKTPAEVAIYATATRAVWLGLVFVMPIALAFQPIIAELAENGRIDRLRKLYVSATRLSTVVGCTPLLLTGVCAGPILAAVYGPRYESGALALAFLSVGQATNAAAGPAATVVTMVGRADLTLAFNATALIADVCLNAVLIPAYGMSGAGAAWCLSLILLCVLRFGQCRREIGARVLDAWLLRAGSALGVGVGITALVVEAMGDFAPAAIAAAALTAGLVTVAVALLALGVRLADLVALSD